MTPPSRSKRSNCIYYEVEQDRKLGLLQRMLDQEQGSFLVFAHTSTGPTSWRRSFRSKARRPPLSTATAAKVSAHRRCVGFQDGEYRVLVATDVASRGIHVEGIAHVVNYDLPQVPEDFIHRVGRTGRAGATGTASTFATRSERSEISQIERMLDAKLVRRQVPADVPAESIPTGTWHQLL